MRIWTTGVLAGVGLVLLTPLPGMGQAAAAIRLQNKAGISVDVRPDQGTYAVRYQSELWLGEGIVSVLVGNRWYRSAQVAYPETSLYKAPDGRLVLEKTRQGSGSDRLGSFDSLELSWKIPGTPTVITTGFRLYRDKPYLVFAQTFPDGFKEYGNGKWTIPSVAFPDFLPDVEKSRKALYSWIYGGLDVQRFAYGPATSAGGTVDVLLLADQELNTVVLSPFANYLVATQQSTPVATRDESESVKGEIACGIEGLVKEIPAGFEHQHIMVAGSGITRTLDQWGLALLSKTGKELPSKYAGDNMKYLTYWDDYGAYYNTHRFMEDGYKSYEDIILGVAKDAKEHGLRIGAYQVQDSDQMQFQDGLFEPRADLFPHGLQWLHEQLGVPLEGYTSWVAPGGPYRKKYPYYETPSGNILGWPSGSMGDVFYSENYWKDTASKLTQWGDISLQQDYQSTYDGDPVMMADVNKMEGYYTSEAKALQEKGMTMQYCMTFARNVLQSTENPIVVSLQSSADHHVYLTEPKPQHRDDDPYMWKQMLFASALYGAVGLWPSRDNIQTAADPNAWEDVLVANLMGGEIQLGHRIGEANVALLQKTYRDGDQLILKPDHPIVPLDRCYLEQCAVGWAASTIHGVSWYYVLSLPRSGRLDQFTLSDLHLDGRWIVYDSDAAIASVVGADTPIRLRADAKRQYLTLAPLFSNGMAILGDMSKFITMADMRLSSVMQLKDGLEVGLTSSAASNPIITGYSSHRPTNVAVGSNEIAEQSSLDRLQRGASGWFWDPLTKLWYVKPDFSGKGQMDTVVFSIRATDTMAD